MKKTLIVLCIVTIAIIGCKSDTKKEAAKYNRIALVRDTVNIVKLSDTLVIFESTCRGCAMEGSTHFDISDSLGIIKMAGIKTIDSNPSDMAGGNISKQLILVPVKTGRTTIRMYKFWEEKETPKDSANSVLYTIEVQN